MSESKSVYEKRLILSTVRTRFSPEVQTIREQALDSIVERVMAGMEEGRYYAEQEIQKQVSRSTGFHVVVRDIHSSLGRLSENSRVEELGPEPSGAKLRVRYSQKPYFRLSDDKREEIEQITEESTRQFDAVVRRLFENWVGDHSVYVNPFLKFLSLVFSQLADEYVDMLRGQSTGDSLVSARVFSSAMRGVRDDLRELDSSAFENAGVSFFRDSDPEFAVIKWKLAQSHYVLRAMGVSEGSLLLSRELFGGGVFYLDTNVVIPALASEEPNHTGVAALADACRRIEASM